MSQFDDLQRGVAKDPALQERLGAAEDDESFVATAASIAGELGLELTTEDIVAGIRVGHETPPAELSESQLEAVAGGGLSLNYATVVCRSLGQYYTVNCDTVGCLASTALCTVEP